MFQFYFCTSLRLFVLLGILSILTACHNGDKNLSTTQNYGNQETMEDLNSIKEELHQFVSQYNKKHHTNWQVNSPSMKLMLSKCEVPFKIEWLILQELPDTWRVKVSCTKDKMGADWKIILATDRPILSHEK